MRLGLVVLAAGLLGLGCAGFDDAGAADTDDFIDMDTPPGNCSAGPDQDPCPDPGTGGSPEGGPCLETQDCQSGNACVAPFVDGEVGEFTCSSQCIELNDQTAWCLDGTACCDGAAVCTGRGLCVLPEGGVDESGTGTAGTDTGGTDTGGTGGSTGGSSGGTDSGTAGSGSETGAATGTTGMR